MKIVGLKIEKGLVAATVVSKGFRQTELVDSFSQPFATDAELVEILKEKSGDWAGAKIISSIPGQYFSQRTVQFPFSDRKRVEKALPFEIEDAVPFALEDVVLDHVALETGKIEKGKEAPVLGMMLPKTILRRHIDLLATAGIDPQVILPSYIGLHAISRMMAAEGCTLLICGRDLCMTSSGIVHGLRSFFESSPTGGLGHTIQSLETERHERIEKAFVLCADENIQAQLSELGIAVEHVAPELGGKKAVDPVSLGLALTEEVNFRAGEFAYRAADEGIRRKKRTLIVAGAVAALLLVVDLSVNVYVVESRYGKLDREIKDLYRKTFPESRSEGDAGEMRRMLEESKKKFGVLGAGTSALDVMRAVTDGIPKEVRVSFTEFNLEGERLKIQGEASSFESVDKIKAEMLKSPVFAEVTVLDTRMGVENKVKFRMDIKLKQAL